MDHGRGLVLGAGRRAAAAGVSEGGDAGAAAAQGAAGADDVHHVREPVRRAQHGRPRPGPAKHRMLFAALRMVALAVVSFALADVRWFSVHRAIKWGAL